MIYTGEGAGLWYFPNAAAAESKRFAPSFPLARLRAANAEQHLVNPTTENYRCFEPSAREITARQIYRRFRWRTPTRCSADFFPFAARTDHHGLRNRSKHRLSENSSSLLDSTRRPVTDVLGNTRATENWNNRSVTRRRGKTSTDRFMPIIRQCRRSYRKRIIPVSRIRAFLFFPGLGS